MCHSYQTISNNDNFEIPNRGKRIGQHSLAFIRIKVYNFMLNLKSIKIIVAIKLDLKNGC